MNISTAAVIVVICIVMLIWKKITAKLIKIVLSVLAIALIVAVAWMFVNGKQDMLPGGSEFRKCVYDGKLTDYFCTEHIQWECESCHEKKK